MSAIPQGDERAGVSGHGPGSLAGDIAGYVQGVEDTPGAARACVPYWDLVNWQHEAERLQQVLTEQAPLVAAVARYAEVWRQLDESVSAGVIRQSVEQINERMQARQALFDALALARATPDADARHGR